ncbi:protein of unknown function [Methylocella tundrae]|uniref:Uncharacterized protein n=1 Tax=Methylocella tundrae TaxID=227605 RepID=A0A4U8YW63_METTU|nr:protein of unknown function [Methylocella tundrae]
MRVRLCACAGYAFRAGFFMNFSYYGVSPDAVCNAAREKWFVFLRAENAPQRSRAD